MGCWLDNHRGHYITRDVILLAADHGFPLSDEDRAFVDTYDEDCHEPNFDFESLVDLSDRAIDWMNEVLCDRPDDTYFQFLDGDFGLYPAECEECGNGGIVCGPNGYEHCNLTHWCQHDW
jgi:hypothetical protein